MSSPRTTWPHVAVALRAMLVLTVVLGVGYPLLVTGLGRAMPTRADGSLVTDADGRVVGSSLIGQSFTDADGEPLPQYVQPRPSAAGDGYDAAASGGSNLGPENPDLVAAVEERRAAVAELEGVDPADVPADAVTASGSGLDPHISAAYAELQVPRVAAARGMTEDAVRDLVRDATTGPDLGYLGQAGVDVLTLNLALDAARP
ncbi:potassium-transporting ATPase subunit KdpC [Cellulomonas sp. NPDC058312]|uniref:potassium-transporting ATPase subunit KdpC n=1 Tax=Cellulomonas sp. NPDC058312 TaxID=3346441 RepID=UPI0036E73191